MWHGYLKTPLGIVKISASSARVESLVFAQDAEILRLFLQGFDKAKNPSELKGEILKSSAQESAIFASPSQMLLAIDSKELGWILEGIFSKYAQESGIFVSPRGEVLQESSVKKLLEGVDSLSQKCGAKESSSKPCNMEQSAPSLESLRVSFKAEASCASLEIDYSESSRVGFNTDSLDSLCDSYGVDSLDALRVSFKAETCAPFLQIDKNNANALEAFSDTSRASFKVDSSDLASISLLVKATDALRRFLCGELLGEVDFPCAFKSAFSERILRALCEIGFGERITYSELGARLGVHQRSVARAMASNKILLLYPCHRVVAKSGNGGYSATGGVEKKLEILRFEAMTKEKKQMK